LGIQVARADDERIMEKLSTVYMAYQYGIGEEMELGFWVQLLLSFSTFIRMFSFSKIKI